MIRRHKNLVTEDDRAPAAATRDPNESIGSTPSLGSVTAATAGIVTAWIAAGSTGFLVGQLQHTLAWLGMAVVAVAGSGRRRLRAGEVGVLLAALAVGVALTAPAMAVYNVVAVALVLAAMAWTAKGLDRKALLIAAYASAVLGIYRLAITAIPSVWLGADAVGEAIGGCVGAACGKPLRIGATFAGLDFLVLMTALCAAWLKATAPPRLLRAVCVVAAIAGGHLVYLVALAHTHDLLAAIPKRPAVEAPLYQSDLYLPPLWYWGDAARAVLPWNLPLLAAALHAVTTVLMFRWARWLPGDSKGSPDPAATSTPGDERAMRLAAGLGLGAAASAVLIPLVTMLSTRTLDLAGRKIVAYEHGYLDWEKPKFDRYGEESAGMYGMLPALVSSMGGQFVTTPNLAPSALDGAHVLLLIHPTQRWSAEERRRVWDYVRGGGSLLVVAEPRVPEDGQASSINELLDETAMEVRFDTAIPVAPHWQHGLEAAVHPAGAGIDRQTNGFGLEESSSVRLGWPARPIVVGRWGWSDPGSDAVLTGIQRFDAGERLGDLVLAAEQPVGSGTVVVLADTGCLKNEGLANAYEFTGRLLGYLATRGSAFGGLWRQALGVAACLALVVLLAWRLDAASLGTSLALLVVMLGLAETWTAASARILPDGRGASPNSIACIDASHGRAFSNEPWSDDGLAGLELTLMRNGRLPIVMRHWSDEQVQRAGMLISIGPSRPFSGPEGAAVRRFLENGGVMLCMAGANHAGPIQPLLNDFGLAVPLSPLSPDDPGNEPRPMGFFRTPYLDTGKYRVHVGFYAGWPVLGKTQDTEALVQGFNDSAVIVRARVGKGRLILIGDTCFAMNKNLEAREGDPPRGFVENAHFWRWLIAGLNDSEWIPPEPKPEAAGADEDSTDDDSPGAPADGAAKPVWQMPIRPAGKEKTR